MDPDSGQMKNKISNPDPDPDPIKCKISNPEPDPDPIKCKFLDPNPDPDPIGSGSYPTGSIPHPRYALMMFLSIYFQFAINYSCSDEVP